MLFANKYPSHLRQTRRSALVLLTLVSGLMFSRPALASEITVASPVSGTNVASPIWVRAHNVGCDSLAPTAFGYSIDNSSTFVRGVTPYDVDATKVAIGAGSHTIHFKSWTSNGLCPVVNTTFTVGGSTTTSTAPATAASTVASIPSNAVASADLDGSGSWSGEHDAGTAGSSKGSMVYPAKTPSYDDAREFYMTYSGPWRRALAPFLCQKCDRHSLCLRHVRLPRRSIAGSEHRVGHEPGHVEWRYGDLWHPMLQLHQDLGVHDGIRRLSLALLQHCLATPRIGLQKRGTTSRLPLTATAAEM